MVLKTLALAVVAVALAVACSARADDVPEVEQRWHEINKTIMCPLCPGESIDQSQNELAVQMRGIVRQQIEDGWTDEQIRAFWVERYGPSVLLEPPRQGFSLLVWLLPPVGVVVAGVALYFALSRMRRPSAPQTAKAKLDVEVSDDDLSPYLRRVEALFGSEATPGSPFKNGKVTDPEILPKDRAQDSEGEER